MEIENRARDKGGDATFVQTDVPCPQVENLIAETIGYTAKSMWHLIIEGGNLYFGPVENMTGEQFAANIMLNLTGTFTP